MNNEPGAKLRAAREAAGLTRKQLAAQMNPPTSAHYLYQIETGRRNPGVKIAVGLEDRLGLAVRTWV